MPSDTARDPAVRRRDQCKLASSSNVVTPGYGGERSRCFIADGHGLLYGRHESVDTVYTPGGHIPDTVFTNAPERAQSPAASGRHDHAGAPVITSSRRRPRRRTTTRCMIPGPSPPCRRKVVEEGTEVRTST